VRPPANIKAARSTWYFDLHALLERRGFDGFACVIGSLDLQGLYISLLRKTFS
jgi:hypothetical protein